MSKIVSLLKAYERRVALPWQNGLSGREKVWFCIYDPRDERRLRMRLPEFQTATTRVGRTWGPLFDVTTRFEQWMADQEYRESYFAEPELLETALEGFHQQLVGDLQELLAGAATDSIVPVLGAGALFGIPGVSVSGLVEQVAESVRGRLLVFFPGTREESNYRLLDARDGWDYLAVPIEADER